VIKIGNYELIIYFQNGEGKIIANKDIKILDYFTSEFECEKDLIDHFQKDLKVKIKNIKLRYQYKKDNEEKSKTLDIKYANDIYKEDSVKNKYYQFLKQNKKYKIKFLSKFYPNLNNDMKNITILESENNFNQIFEKYFKEYNYRKYRDAYFELKKNNVDVLKYDELKDSNKKEDSSSHLKKFTSNSLEIEEVIERGDMDELFSLYDLDELRNIKNTYSDKPLVDGLYQEKKESRR